MSYNQMQQQSQPQTMYYTPQPQPQPFRTPYVLGLKCRPVSSIDEARAMSIDFDGSVFYFPDLANNRIYTKQINMDGTVSLLMYTLTEIPTTTPTSQDYVTRQEFEAFLAKLNGASPVPPDGKAGPQEFKF